MVPHDGGVNQILLELNSYFLLAVEDFVPSCPNLGCEKLERLYGILNAVPAILSLGYLVVFLVMTKVVFFY